MTEVATPGLPPQHLMGAALDFLRANDWPVPRRIAAETIELDFARDDVPWTCYLEARENERQVIFYSTLAEPAPRERIAAMFEFVARANYGLAIGNFEIDPEDGEVRFKTSVDVNNTLLTDGLLSGLTALNVATMNVYLPGIRAVMAGGDPRAAVALVEA